MTNNKKRTGVLAGLLAGALLVTGTLAWQDVNQHKTNKFTTTSVEHNVTLVEAFEEVTNWRKGEAKVNQIAVRNGQDTDDITSYIYEDAYVRVQLKEFMEIKNKSYTYSEKRYMVDEKGNFKRFATLELAQEFMATLGEEAPLDGRIEEVTGLFDKDDEGNAKGFFYIATQQADKNGQYGKFIVMTEVLGEGDVLVEGSINQDHSSEDQHNNAIVDEETGAIDYNVDEDQYTTHLWGSGDNMSAEGNPFTQYVKWTFGEDVITMSEWDGQPTAQWIVDTDSTEGYAYWGASLTHGIDTVATPKSLTSNILEKVTLIEQPYGAAEYYIHVNMDAVNLKDVALWDDAPEKITKAHNGMDDISVARKALKNAMDLATDLDAGSVNTPAGDAVVSELARVQAIHDNPKASQEELNQAKIDLDAVMSAFKNDALTIAKKELAKTAQLGLNADTDWKTQVSVKALEEAMLNANTLLEDTNATPEDVIAANQAVKDAMNGLEEAQGPAVNEGRITNFADHNWTVLKTDEATGNSLVISDVLSQDDLAKMGVTSTDGKVRFTTGATADYNESYIKVVDDAFYESFVAGTRNADAVLPVSFTVEKFLSSSTWSTRKDAPTSIDEAGEKRAFSLSISDINYYALSAANLKTTVSYWTRSVASTATAAGSVTATGGLATGSTALASNVRVAMWIKTDK